MPKISVIIQGHKDRGFFDECITSVFDQTFSDYEIILSSDGNPELERYAEKYGIQFSLSPKHNHSLSVDRAIKMSSGEWVKVLDDDDLLLPTSLQDCWDNRIADMIQGNAKLIRSDGVHLYKGKEITLRSLLPLITNPINWATVFFSREGYNKSGGFDPIVHFANDYDLYLSFLSKGLKIGYVDKTLGIYRIHDTNMSKNCTYFKVGEKAYLENKYREAIYNYMRTLVNDDLG